MQPLPLQAQCNWLWVRPWNPQLGQNRGDRWVGELVSGCVGAGVGGAEGWASERNRVETSWLGGRGSVSVGAISVSTVLSALLISEGTKTR